MESAGQAEPRIIHKDEMILVGVASDGKDIHGLWEQFMAKENLVKDGVHTVGYELHTHPEEVADTRPPTIIECVVGIQVTKAGAVRDGMVVRRLPAGEYAVFTHRLAQGGYEGKNAEMARWLKTGPYRLSHPNSLQVYDERFKGGTDPESEIDFLLPVELKPKGAPQAESEKAVAVPG